ncbi:MAG: hypothetical protein AB7F99_04905 [Vicinamibacterales bacterium]
MSRGLQAVLLLLLPSLALAQDAPRDRFGVAVGGRWIGPASLGRTDATLTTPSGGTVTLFSTNTELESVSSVEARAGVRIWRGMHVEATAAIGFARLVTRIDDDFEGTADNDVSESIRQLTLGAALLAELGGRPFGGRLVPFITAGGGYVKQLHGGRSLVNAGHTYHGGFGVNYLFRSGTGWTGRQTAVGLRFDGRADVRAGGIVLDEQTHTAFSVGALLFYRF